MFCTYCADVRCGEETRVVPRLLQMRSHWMKSQKESLRLEEAGKAISGKYEKFRVVTEVVGT